MLMPTARRLRRHPVTLAVVAVLIAAAAVTALRPRASQHTLVAYFTRAVGVHPGSDVRVLGVRVGEVTAVRPEGTSVRVELDYDAKVPVPADVRAVIVPPSVVSDRYVQLTPAYASGPTAAEGVVLPTSRTAVPVELDDVYRALDELNRALGPQGANRDGALSTLVATGKANLAGNGTQLHDALAHLSRAAATLAAGRADLFGTVADLADFTTALAQSDQQVRLFNAQLAQVGEELAGERQVLAAALHSLSVALADVTSFVRDNRAALKSNVEALADITGALVRQEQALIEVLDVGPLALSNLNLAYNARSGTIDTRDDAMGPYQPAEYVCSLLVNAQPISKVPTECFNLVRLLTKHKLPVPAVLRPLLKTAAGAVGGDAPAHDPTLGGILRGGQ